MDWNLAIEKNTHALAQIVAGLWRLVGVEPKSVEDYEPSISSTVLATSSSSDLIRGSKSEPVAILSVSAIGRPECSCVDGRFKSDHDAKIEIGPITRRILIRTLRTVEAALRRLIVLYVYVHGVKVVARKRQERRNRPLPDFASFGASYRPPVFRLFDPRKPLTLMLSLSKHEEEVYGASPLRQAQGEGFGLSSPDLSTSSSSSSDLFRGSRPVPRIWFASTTPSFLCLAQESMPEDAEHLLHHRRIGEAAGMDPRDKPEDDGLRWIDHDGVGFPPSVAAPVEATSRDACARTDDDTEVSAEKLIRRLAALDHALNTIPQQAKRLARIMAQREHAPAGAYSSPAAGNPLRGSLPSHPIRPGIPPGSNKQSNEPSHEILRELHGLVRDWEKDAWERRCENLSVP